LCAAAFSSVPKSSLVYQQNDYQHTKHSVPTGVTNVKCAKVNQMYQNSLEMMPSVLNADPNATGVPNVATVTNVPRKTMNDPSVPVFGSVHFYVGL